MRKLVPIVLFLFACLATARAQGPTPAPCTFRTLRVSVLDKNGEPITGLTAADFRAEFRGKPVTIRSANQHAGPGRIVILLDQSGSMERAWTRGVEAVIELLQWAPTDVPVAVLLFGDGLTNWVGFHDRRDSAIAALSAAKEKHVTRGLSRLRDSIVAILDQVPSLQPGHVLLVVSDGEDSSSRATYSDVREHLLQRGVRLFFYRLGYPVRHRSPDVMHPDLLAELTKVSGGGSLPAGLRLDERPAQAARLRSLISNYYELEIDLPAPPDRRQAWRVDLARKKDFKGSGLIYPRYLMPCSQGSRQP